MTAPPMGPMGPPAGGGMVDQLNDPTQAAAQAALQAFQLHQQAAPSQANQIVAPKTPDFAIDLDQDDLKKRLATALYGSDFPPVNADPNTVTDADWCSWVAARWASHRGAVERHLWLVERNRLFRAGQQWVSSNAKGRGPWREPMKPAETARVVYNMIDKALDQRLQVLADQRPGFVVEPSTQDPEDKSQAKARQLALEDQYDKQNMGDVMSEAEFWAQTDGVSFLHEFWDPDAGPWDESMGEMPNSRKPLGDLTTEVVRCEQVRVSANATKTRAPYYVILREVLPVTETAYLYGIAGVSESSDQASVMTGGPGSDGGMNRYVLDHTTIGEGDRLRDQDVVERFTMYVEPQPDILPDGLQITTLGNHVIWGPGPLLFKMLPVIPVRDGSTDPSYFPRPIMEQWIDHQMRVNALVSAIIDSVRVNKSGRFIARPGAVQQETFLGGGTNILEVNGAIGSLDDIIKPVDGFSIGEDVKDQLANEIKAFENASGWNDQSRGQISGDASGRAILAAREQLERVFAPPVGSAAQAFTQWGKVTVAGMAFGYDVPRTLGSVGNSRPDLAAGLTKQMFDGPMTIKVDKETLMPVPRVYREFRLDDLLAKGILSAQQYARRMQFGFIDDLETPDEDQEARAKRVVAALLNGSQVPEIRWQDNEAIHQDVLERDILLQDDKSPEIIAIASQRWTALANQAQMKAGGMMGPPPPDGGFAGGPAGPTAGPGAPSGASAASGPGSPSAPGPLTQPLPMSQPSQALPMSGNQQDDAARVFEGMAPH